jgi:phage shock protein C
MKGVVRMKTFYRSQDNRKLTGVCGGIAERWELDATFVRLFIAAAAVFSFGTVLLLYAAASLLLPVRHSENALTPIPVHSETCSPLMSNAEEFALRREIETLRARMATFEPNETNMQNIR